MGMLEKLRAFFMNKSVRFCLMFSHFFLLIRNMDVKAV